MSQAGGKRGRKVGNNAKSAAHKRYWSFQQGYDNRRELHKARRMRRFDRMVANSRARRALERQRPVALP